MKKLCDTYLSFGKSKEQAEKLAIKILDNLDDEKLKQYDLLQLAMPDD